METKAYFKQTIDNFFTKKYCNNWLRNEDDFQAKIAQHLVANGFQVLREVHVSNDDIKLELNQEYIFVDIVAYKNGLFFPVELKFENANYQTKHLTLEGYQQDKKKIKILFNNYKDMPVTRKRILTNNSQVRQLFTGEWHALLDGQSGENEFMWQWHWWHDGLSKRIPKYSFVKTWNENVEKRLTEGFKEGESAEKILSRPSALRSI